MTGGSGADSIFAGASDASIDRIIYSATTDGAAAGAVTGHDTISEFEVGTDKIAFTSTLNTNFDDISNNDVIALVTNAPADFTTTHEAMLITGLLNTDITTSGWANILFALNTTYGITSASTGAGADAIIVVQGATQTGFYLYTELGTASNIVSGELTLLGISNGLLTTSDFIFA
jgi:hypothetical protein